MNTSAPEGSWGCRYPLEVMEKMRYIDNAVKVEHGGSIPATDRNDVLLRNGGFYDPKRH
jgi:hypothetical protein